ncbi:unnamed protein product, partial [marine sediment metagenome]
MSPQEKRSGKEELDAFQTASQNSLFPKLIYSKHYINDLLDMPDDYEAHITFLFDAFPVSVNTAEPIEDRRSNYLFGILYEYINYFSSQDGNIFWKRQISPKKGIDIDDSSPVHEIMTNLYWLYSKYSGVISSDGIQTGQVPTIYLSLGSTEKNLISQVHQSSDWVLTIDRNFGLEYMDSPYDDYCPVYLIDYQPEYLSEVGHRLIISTQHLTEVQQFVKPVLENLDIPSNPEIIEKIIHALRS